MFEIKPSRRVCNGLVSVNSFYSIPCQDCARGVWMSFVSILNKTKKKRKMSYISLINV